MKEGSLVQCTHKLEQSTRYYNSLPSIGECYVVRDLIVNEKGEQFIRLWEIFNSSRKYTDGYKECMFDATAFKELLPPPQEFVEQIWAGINY